MDYSMIELNDFPIVCRICLEKKEKLISIFTEISNLEGKSYREMLKECASVNISENDTLPKNVCLQCSKYLKQSYKLKVQCLSSEKHLQSLIENSQKIKVEEPFSQNEILDNDFNFYDDDDNKDYDFNFYESKTNYPMQQVEVIVKEELSDNFTDNSSNSKKINKVVNYKCTDCEAQFTCANKLFDHSVDVHSKSVVQCEFCKTDFNTGNDLRIHCSDSTICKWCLKDCDCINNLTKHNQEHNVCDKCGKTFKNAELCQKHMEIHIKENKNNGFLCTYCGKSFSNRSNMTIHTRKHTGEKPYQCDICEAQFIENRHLKRHMNKHSTEKKFECDICSAKYKWEEGLRQHKLAQHMQGEFPCTICDKICNTKKYLRRHLLSHSGKPRGGEWNLVCTYCNKLFNRKDNLKVHLRIHTGEKPFVCNKCGRGFSAKHVLNGHMKTCNIKNNII